MMQEIIISGFGGQGVMTIGKILAKVALKAGKNVSWLPSYGPEMRGGTANCNIKISDHEIGNPIVSEATVLIALNQPSLDKFEEDVLPGGILLINSSLTNKQSVRNDVTSFYIPANDIANGLGTSKVANMVILGAYFEISSWIDQEVAHSASLELIGGKKSEMIALNREALKKGAEYIRAAARPCNPAI